MRHALRKCLAAVLFAAFGAAPTKAAGPAPPDWLDTCNVVWDEPSKDSSGSMPLGNGDIGLNLWVEPSGDLVFYLSKTDAWDAHARLLKLGRLRVKLSPNPLAGGKGDWSNLPGHQPQVGRGPEGASHKLDLSPFPSQAPFRQELRLRQAEIVVAMGRPGEAVTLRVWVDANQPVVRVEVAGDKPVSVQADLELWRTKEAPLEGKQRDAARGLLGAPYPLVVPADTVAEDPADAIVWYHRNVTSGWPVTMKVQGLEGLVKPSDDPLLHRTFGGSMSGRDFVKSGPTTLKSRKAAASHCLTLCALTRTPATEAEWLGAIAEIRRRAMTADLDAARQAHLVWWRDFWDRSWIRVSGQGVAGPRLTANDLPLRIGANTDGGSRFAGLIGRPMLFRRALSAGEVAQLAAGTEEKLVKDPDLLGYWPLDSLKDGVFANAAGPDLAAKAVGEVEVVDAPRGAKAIKLAGKGFLEVADHPKLRLEDACTLAAWVALDKASSPDGRIIDKSKVATSNGYLLDVHPNDSLRMITEPNTLVQKGVLKHGRWTHVAATFDAAGNQCLYVDGKLVASHQVGGRIDAVTQGYALQRFINAAGGRGAMPIKFNGSIFTVDAMGSDGDYRRWGSCYWWQNTRLPYWAMLACGDYDLMMPLCDMYRKALPLAKGTTKLYYGHEGAFFAETIYFWGTPCNDDFGWDRKGHPQHLMVNEYIRRLWEGGIELSLMMLDAYDHTQDAAFARDYLVPFADAIATFYAQHYHRDDGGRLRIEPAQSLETWWTAVDPMPEVAGLHAVLPRLVALPDGLATAEQRSAWKRLLDELPPVPLREQDGNPLLAPARSFSRRQNCENPELYAIFPYRLYGVGRPDLDVARRSFEARAVKGSVGWQQDPVQAALLGLADQAARLTAARFSTKDPGSRFPAFWGPNFDWTPDQCHGGNAMLGLQAMVMQPWGEKVYLLPAWPKGWDVEFKLRAPRNTTVEGIFRNGQWEKLVVTPEVRAADVVKCDAQ